MFFKIILLYIYPFFHIVHYSSGDQTIQQQRCFALPENATKKWVQQNFYNLLNGRSVYGINIFLWHLSYIFRWSLELFYQQPSKKLFKSLARLESLDRSKKLSPHKSWPRQRHRRRHRQSRPNMSTLSLSGKGTVLDASPSYFHWYFSYLHKSLNVLLIDLQPPKTGKETFLVHHHF